MPTAAPADHCAAFAALRRTWLVRWRAWVETLAADGEHPPALEVLEAGAVLGIRSPMDQLAADAAAVREVRELEATADAQRERITAKIDALGGPAGIRARIRELRAELAELAKWSGPDAHYGPAHTRGAAAGIRRRHPRIFDALPDVTPKPEPTPTKKRKKEAAE